MTEPEGRVYGRQAEQCERPSEVGDLDLGKPWDFLGVDWARNQVIAIHRVLNQLSQRLSEVEAAADQISEELAGTDRNVGRLHERITAVEARVIELDQELAGTDKAVAAHNDRISKLEDDHRSTARLDHNRLSAIEAALRDYGIPLGNQHMASSSYAGRTLDFGPGKIVDDHSMTGLNYGVMGNFSEHDDAVREAALNEAERRVRDYMKGHFSDASIGGVVRALRGEDETYGGRLPLGHLFRFNSFDRRHCSWLPPGAAKMCGRLASEH